MKAAIELLAEAPVGETGRRIAVLGDMLELGSHSAKLHAGLADVIAGTSVDLVLMAGPEMKALAERLPADFRAEYRPQVDELQALLVDMVRPGDVVMVKSSNGIGLSRIVDALVKKFPAAASNSHAA
jgi:UDP-N-acetylmuramoyl-tripeptide--D-alanyl-D-alanine ligase